MEIIYITDYDTSSNVARMAMIAFADDEVVGLRVGNSRASPT